MSRARCGAGRHTESDSGADACTISSGDDDDIATHASNASNAKPNAKPNDQPDAKPNAKSNAKPDAKPDTKPDARMYGCGWKVPH